MDFNKLWQKKQADADEVEEKVDSTNNKVVHKKSVEQEALNTVCNELFQVLIDLKIINSSAATSAPRPKKQADIFDMLQHMGVTLQEISHAFSVYLKIPLYEITKFDEPELIGKDWVLCQQTVFLINPLGNSINDLMQGKIKGENGKPLKIKQFGVIQLEKFEELSETGTVQSYVEKDNKKTEQLHESETLLAEIMEDAIERRCSDIHIEPGDEEGFVRMRVHGHLITRMTLSMGRVYDSLANVLLTRSRNDPGAYISPKDGQFHWDLHNRRISIRLNMVPTTIQGSIFPKFTLRLLGLELNLSELHKLKLSDSHVEQFQGISRRPNGLFLVTGPTGSGKTTTLYSIMRHTYKLNSDKSFYTLEDPVEIPIAGFNQIEVNPAANMTFAAGLRALLRADPDVIMVGEIRDAETAELAVRASLTGHLVLSTLHSNFAMGTIPRLLDMGIDQSLLSDALIGISAQRMVSKLCSFCSKRVPADDLEDQLKPYLHLRNCPEPTDLLRVANPEGCFACSSGYSGRRIVNEIVPVNRELASMISRKASMGELHEFQNMKQYNNLWEDGIRLVRDGETTLEQIEALLGAPPEEG
jgi:type II secretory ATPase GspE/PulE/Tfp pilus assembly ATPase PilB-like protein